MTNRKRSRSIYTMGMRKHTWSSKHLLSRTKSSVHNYIKKHQRKYAMHVVIAHGTRLSSNDLNSLLAFSKGLFTEQEMLEICSEISLKKLS